MAGNGRGFWSTLFGGPERSRFSVEELEHLHLVLLRNSVVSDANRDLLVETLRSISELVIWGDQHDSELVDYFLTNNMLGHFTKILQQRSNRRGGVAQQVLQTLSILLQNVRHQQTVYFLFSNNHLNDIVAMQFDFEDDEVLGYYINLLKTISLRLNEATVQFFFQAGGGRGGAPPALPLYSEAIRFIGHRDGMVRAAVKTLTLNVYAIPLPEVHAFVTSGPPAQYLATLASLLAAQCAELDRRLVAVEEAGPAVLGALSGCLAEVEDMLSYCNDVLATGIEPLRRLLLDALWQAFVGPICFWPLIQDDVAIRHIHQFAPSGGGSAGSGAAGTPANCAAPSRVNSEELALRRGAVGPLTALYVLERLFTAVTDTPLLCGIVAALFDGSAFFALTPVERGALQYSPAAYRAALVGMMTNASQEPQLAVAAARLLAALLASRTLDEGLLESIGLLPRRRMRQLELLTALTRESAPPGGRGAQAPAGSRPGSGVPSRAATPDPEASLSPRATSGLPLPPLADPALAEQRQAELVDALLAQLACEWIPPRAVVTLSWVLTQLLVDARHGATLTPAQRASLSQARLAAWRHLERVGIGGEKGGKAARDGAANGRTSIPHTLSDPPSAWPDAIPALAELAWPAVRRNATQTGAGGLHVAVAVWADLLSAQSARWAAQAGEVEASLELRVAQSARATARAVARACAVSCALHALLTGSVPEGCPLAGEPAAPAARAVREGAVLPSIPAVEGARGDAAAPIAVPCTVAFQRGKERHVELRVERESLRADDDAASPSASPPTTVCLAELINSAWVVIATAPLLGADPRPDERHARWLHVTVRPPAAALVAAAARPQAASPAGPLALAPPAALAQALGVGQWTVACRSEADAEAALRYMRAQAQAARAALSRRLCPLLMMEDDAGA